MNRHKVNYFLKTAIIGFRIDRDSDVPDFYDLSNRFLTFFNRDS